MFIFETRWPMFQAIDFVQGSFDQIDQALAIKRKQLLAGAGQAGFTPAPARRLTGVNLRDAADALLPVVRPGPNKLALCEVVGTDWCFFLANSEHGINPIYDAQLVAEDLSALYVRVVCRLEQGTVSIQFQHFDYRQGDRSKDRIVYVHQEGGWTFFQRGPLLPFEEHSSYEARAKKDRLTKAHLEQYLSDLGIASLRTTDVITSIRLHEYPCSPHPTKVLESLDEF